MLHHIYEQIGTALATVAFAFIAALIAKFSGMFKPKRPIDFEAASAKGRKQKEVLEHLRVEIGATRCYLTRFFNGEHFVDGSDILRKSRVIEVVRPGTSYEADRFRSVLVSTVTAEMEYVEDDGPGWFVTSELPLSNFRQTNEEIGVKSGARAVVRKQGKPVGYIGADFDTERKPDNINEIVKHARWMERNL